MPNMPAVPTSANIGGVNVNPTDLAAKGQAIQASGLADISKAVPPMPQEAV